MLKPSPATRRDALRALSMGLAAAALSPLARAKTPEFPKGAIIRTVLKDLPPDALAGGATLFHEHLSLAPDFMPRWIALARGAAAPPPPPPNAQPFFMADLDLMAQEMKAAAADGVACIVDGGHEDMGRDLTFLKQLSMQSGVPIVAGAGYYAQPFYPPEIARMSEDEIAQELIRRVNAEPIGVFGEIGTWREMTADERKVFRAVAKAHLQTNLPIFTHTDFGKGAVEQLDLLESIGVKPSRVAIGHVGGLQDPKADVAKSLCKRGAFVGYDRQGGPGDANNVPQILALIEAGYADNLLFSSDLSMAQQVKHNGGTGYGKTLTVFVPKLREAGVKEEALHGILTENPRKFIAFVPKKPRKS
jgi:phosphotriesterase-related protein